MTMTLRGEHTLSGPAIPRGAPGAIKWWDPELDDDAFLMFERQRIGRVVAKHLAELAPGEDPKWVYWMKGEMERSSRYREHVRGLIKAGRLVMRPVRDSASKSAPDRIIAVALREAMAPTPIPLPAPTSAEGTEYFELEPGGYLRPGWLLRDTRELATLAMKNAARDLGMAVQPTIRWYAPTGTTPDWLLGSQPVERVWDDGSQKTGFVHPLRPSDIWIHGGLMRHPQGLAEVAAHETFHQREATYHGFPSDTSAKDAEEREAEAFGRRVRRRMFGS